MASSNKTDKLQLPQWQLSDKPEMSDFNDAFNKVEDFKDEFDSHKAEYVNLQDDWEGAKESSLLNLSSLNKITEKIPDAYMGQYNAINLTGVGDLNDVIYSGLYYVVYANINNVPVNSNGYLLVITAHQGHCMQIYSRTTISDFTLHIRKCTSGTNWGDWGTIG